MDLFFIRKGLIRREMSMGEYIAILKRNLSESTYLAYEKLTEKKFETFLASLNHWYFDDLGKWTWWLSLGLTVIPLIIWWKIADKTRLLEIIVLGLLANTTASFLDVVGSEAVLWGYPDRLFPNFPRILPIDFTVIPVTFMVIYQYFPDWKRYSLAIIAMSFIYSFVAEPLLVLIGLYELYAWKFVYSFPIYIIMGLFLRLVVELFIVKQKASKYQSRG